MSNPRAKKLFLCMFEDTEAVIKMIFKGRSPTMRHVFRTHRVALDWLFDRINLVGELVVFIRLKTSGTAHFVLSQKC